MLRCSEVLRYTDHLDSFNEVIRLVAQNVTHFRLDGNLWCQAFLPAANGGIGLQKASYVALPAYIASLFSVREKVMELVPSVSVYRFLLDAVDRLMEISGADVPEIENQVLQKHWTHRLYPGSWKPW